MHRYRLRAASLLVTTGLICVGPAAAGPRYGTFSGDLSRLDEIAIDRRYDFIRQQLDDGKLESQIWQYGFLSVWAVGAGLGTARALVASDKIERTTGIVTSVKAVGGVTRLLWSPNPGRQGADNIEMLPATSLDQKRTRLAAAETLLGRVEERALSRSQWQGHVSNVAINLLGGGIILGIGGVERGWDDALASFGMGVVAGEVMSFTMPERGIKDAEDYRAKFSVRPHEPRVSWHVLPTSTGISLHLEF